jgi:hypothetical protein
VAISLDKKGFIENHKKNKFPGIWQTVRGWLFLILIPEFLGKSFRENTLPGGLSADPRRTVCYSLQNRVLLGGPGGRSAACLRTVRVAQADSPRGPGGRSARPNGQPPAADFAFLPLEFKRGQSARASRTVREVRVLSLTASNGRGEYLYSKPGVGESLLAL